MRILGKGSVIQRDKTKTRSRCREWELALQVSDDSGRHRKSRRFRGTYTQAQKELERFKAELQSLTLARDMPFGEYADIWHKRRVSSGALAKRSLDGEANKLKAAKMHLEAPICDLSREHIQDAYTALMDGETPSGRTWSPQTVAALHRILKTLFNDAVRDGYLDKSPMVGVRLPKAQPKRHETLTNEEMDSLLESIDYSDGPQRAIALCCACGLRRSEACAVKWEDLRDGVLHVEVSLEDDGTEKVTKSGRSRAVPVPARVLEQLEGYRGKGRICGDMRPDVLTNWWVRERERKFGLTCRLHDLRHGYATRLARAQVHPRTMMELGGWSSIGICMNIYTHVNDDMRRQAVDAAFK